MKDFDAWGIVRLLGFIDLADQAAHLRIIRDATGMYEMVSDDFKAAYSLQGILAVAQYHAKNLHMEATLNRVWDGGPFTMAFKAGLTYQDLRNELKVLRESIEADLEKRFFLFIPPDDNKRMLESGKVWAAVAQEIPGSRYDGEEAAHCLAFDRHTACVFHCMRAAEYGLRYLAKKTNTTRSVKHKGQKQPIELADWNAIITAINNKITALRGSSRVSVKQTEKISLYSDAADHCVYMKDIWRNRTAHARKPYDKTEAVRCMGRVESFLQFLVSEFGDGKKG